MAREETLKKIQESLGKRIKKFFKKSEKRVYIDIDPEDLREAVKLIFRRLGARFNIASALDLPNGTEILYHFEFDKDNVIVSLRVFTPERKNPVIDSITPIFPGAEWIEREMHELFGIDFKGHPDLRPLLLPDDWPAEKHPLRKDFKA